MYYGHSPGWVQSALGLRVLGCVNNQHSWADFAVELQEDPTDGRRRFVRDNQRVLMLTRQLQKGPTLSRSVGNKNISRLRDLLVGGSLVQSEQVKTWVPKDRPIEAGFKKAVLEPFVESQVTELPVHAVAPPWATTGAPPRRCNAHPPGHYLYRRDCWKRSKWWASVDALGKRHNFDLVAEPQHCFQKDANEPRPARRGLGETLVVEVKLVRWPLVTPDPRFIGQLLLARSIHTHVIGICVVVGPPARVDLSANLALNATHKAVAYIGAHFVPMPFGRRSNPRC